MTEFSVSLELKKKFYEMMRELRKASTTPFSIINRVQSDKIYSVLDAIAQYENNGDEEHLNIINVVIDNINEIRTFEPSNDFTYCGADLNAIRAKFQHCYDFIDGCRVTDEGCEVGEDNWKKHAIFNDDAAQFAEN